MKSFVSIWKRSKKARKQRKYRAHLPLHRRKKLMGVHLSADLRKKHETRSVSIRVGDKIKILRGQFKKKEGKVERVDRMREKLYVTGLEVVKKDGTKTMFPIHPSNVMLVDVHTEKKRKIGKNGGKK
jgi:large subunit ribosomal protein L24